MSESTAKLSKDYSCLIKISLNFVIFLRYNDLRRKYIKQYYWRNPSAYKLVTLLSVRNVKELNNFGKYLCLAEKQSD